MKAKILSIIIPVYNAEKYIGNILRKLEMQKNKRIEVILIDDGSRDRSLEICQKFATGNECFKIFHQENHGASSARNQGIRMAEGEYIVFVDSDDNISSTFVETICTLCDETASDIIQLDSYVVTSKRNEYKEVRLPEGKVEISVYCNFILEQTVNPVWDKIYKTKIIRNNEIYFDVHMVMGEDICFTLDALKYAQSVYMKHSAVYEYKKNEEGLCSNVSDEYLQDLDLLYNKMEEFIMDKQLDNEAYETMHASMLGSVFRAVGLAINNKYSKFEIEPRLKNSCNLQKLLKSNYKNFAFKIRKVLLNKRCFGIISYLVKSKQS